MNKKDVILEQFLLCHRKNGWFVSFQSAVNGLTPEQALWKNTDSENSIWEIISHLVFWNERYLNYYKDVENPKMDGTNDSTFGYLNDLEWTDLVRRFNGVMASWYESIQQSDESRLNQTRQGAGGTWSETLTNITLHNAYHIGQIVTIRKMQGSWSKEKGVS
nr:DinB family protein [Neobacillus sp. Marseille-Q6967]